MSRLTLPHYDGKGHYMRCSEQFGCSGECADCKELDKIIEKLAEYEDKEERKPSTNADSIRAMSDDELAEWMAECNAYGERAYASQWLPWLKQPAE